MQFPYGPLAPDAGKNATGVCLIANGVIPKAEGYGPFPQAVTPGGAVALPDDPRGAITTIKRDGTTQVYFMTELTLQSLETDFTWTQIEASLSCTSGDDWSMEQFGDKLLYTNTTEGMRAYDIEAGGAAAAIAAAGDPREVFICANMVFGLDCKDAAGDRDNRLIKNSDFNDHTDWTTGAADYQPLEEGGALIAGFNLKNNSAIIVQENSLRLLTFGNAGGGALYSLKEIATGRGAVGRKSCIAFDGVMYGLSTNGFFRFSLGGGLEWIGSGQIDEFFLAQVATLDLPKVQVSIEPSKKIVLWRYPTSGDASSTVTENVIGYSWEFNRWFTWSVNLAYLSRVATPGYTLSSWNTAYATLALSPDIPIGDRFWQGGGQILSALGNDLKYQAFSGTPMAVTITTSTGNSPITTKIGRATTIDDAATGTLELGVTDDLATDITWKTGAAKSRAGSVPLRGRGMNVAFRRKIDAGTDWTFSKGVDHIQAAGGGPK